MTSATMVSGGGVHTRNYGIDALRIVAMLMILVHHILMTGGVVGGTIRGTPQYYVGMFLNAMAYVGVNCYALISGYVGVKAKYKYINAIMIWLQVFFYMFLITLGFQIFCPDKISIKNWVDVFFPITTQQYWYITAYIGLFIFMPILNMALNNLSREQVRVMICLVLVIFSVLPTIFRVDSMQLDKGYSVWWLAILYMLGGYIGKYSPLRKCKTTRFLWVYLIAVIVGFGMEMTLLSLGKTKFASFLMMYTSPVYIVASVGLLLFFSRLHFGERLNKIIRFLASFSLGVYIIHTQKLIRPFILTNVFVGYAQLPVVILTIAILGTAIIMYLVCLGIDCIRKKLFELMKIRRKVSKMADWALMKLNLPSMVDE